MIETLDAAKDLFQTESDFNNFVETNFIETFRTPSDQEKTISFLRERLEKNPKDQLTRRLYLSQRYYIKFSRTKEAERAQNEKTKSKHCLNAVEALYLDIEQNPLLKKLTQIQKNNLIYSLKSYKLSKSSRIIFIKQLNEHTQNPETLSAFFTIAKDHFEITALACSYKDKRATYQITYKEPHHTDTVAGIKIHVETKTTLSGTQLLTRKEQKENSTRRIQA